MLKSIATGLGSGLGASILFWLIFFKFSMTSICFSNVLLRQKNVSANGGEYRYRIRIANIGIVNLMDIETRTTIRIKGELTYSAPVVLGNDGGMTMLRKRASYSELSSGTKNPYSSISTIYLTDSSLREFQKSFYDTEIQQKAASGTLTLDDLFDTYKDAMTIRILLHGTDAFSGRRIFVIKEYEFKDIAHGFFSPLKKQWKQEKDKKPISTAFAYKKWLKKALSTVEKETAEEAMEG